MKRYLIPFAIFVVLVVFLAIGLKLDPTYIPSPFIGKPAPEFNLPDLHNPDQRLKASDLKGQVWLLNVWASWCTACRAEHPVIQRLAAMNIAPVYGLNYKDKPEDAKKWLRELGDPYKANLVDRNGDVGIDWGVYGVPETFVIDKKGIIRYKYIGPINNRVVDDEIVPLLRKLNAEAG
ncbi:thiol:disulfide interchange protein DsbE [bacterium BMS3Bbin11]|nr:thiol:disulfide interchange protein DsbE [bacterium BMS3Abin11]GBE45436.1 thiol:disulfide interchange protein DsbE [bacterium BMS3Bbin11]GMT40634.1 MAG: cytochrome C-type biogenesis protein [bacterium]HDH08769.1 DsbE family thiol:disulfide interchange protein [Gammaproteobacteria bacterium]HDH15463.1 DsbE family thiol:disulfide interchange protein [Gammaproteobacteria bacterium]